MEFKKEGLSNENIYKVTHFPIARIENIVRESLPKDNSMSLEDFLQNELKLTQEIYERILNKGKLQTDDEESVISKAIKYGCGRDFIVSMLHINKDKFTRQNKIIKLSDDTKLNDAIKYNKDRRTLKLLNGKVFLAYGKKNKKVS